MSTACLCRTGSRERGGGRRGCGCCCCWPVASSSSPTRPNLSFPRLVRRFFCRRKLDLHHSPKVHPRPPARPRPRSPPPPCEPRPRPRPSNFRQVARRTQHSLVGSSLRSERLPAQCSKIGTGGGLSEGGRRASGQASAAGTRLALGAARRRRRTAFSARSRGLGVLPVDALRSVPVARPKQPAKRASGRVLTLRLLSLSSFSLLALDPAPPARLVLRIRLRPTLQHAPDLQGRGARGPVRPPLPSLIPARRPLG